MGPVARLLIDAAVECRRSGRTAL